MKKTVLAIGMSLLSSLSIAESPPPCSTLLSYVETPQGCIFNSANPDNPLKLKVSLALNDDYYPQRPTTDIEATQSMDRLVIFVDGAADSTAVDEAVETLSRHDITTSNGSASYSVLNVNQPNINDDPNYVQI